MPLKASQPAKDKTGMVFDRLTVTAFSHMVGKKSFWHCLCSCEEGGKPAVIRGDRLLPGRPASCGCLQRESVTRHGKEGTRVYEIWRSMRKRCHLPSAPNYRYYGALGVKVCDRWRESFEAFYADMGDPPSDEHTLDRRDNDGDYTPENCRWATWEEQQNNRSNNTFLEFGGERMTVAQWGRKTGFGKSAILQRLERGWTVERTSPSAPIRPQG